MSYKRSDRVGDLIRQEIASLIQHGDIKDPRVGFVTITHVKMSPDLKEAKVYFSQMGSEEDVETSRDGLNSASGLIRRRLAKTLNLKHIPHIEFFYDETIAYSDHIERVIRDLKKGEGR